MGKNGDYARAFLESLLRVDKSNYITDMAAQKVKAKKLELFDRNRDRVRRAAAPPAATGGGMSLLDAAAAEVGTVGGVSGANKYNGYRAQPWCGDFVNYAARQAGISLPSQTSVYQGLTAMDSMGRYKSRDSGYTPRPGDLVYFNWQDGGNIYDHVGIVESFDGKNLYTIEGNTNGGKVARRTRTLDNVMGYGITE